MPLIGRTKVLDFVPNTHFACLAAVVVFAIHICPTVIFASDEEQPVEVGVANHDAVNQAEQQWKKSGWALVEKYCIECHNQDFQEAELDLSSMKDNASAPENAVMWNRVLQMVRFGAMPPEDTALPSDLERRELTDAIDRSLYAVSCDLRPKAGRVTARRLNRAEYQNTIRDLLSINIDVSGDFPSDEVGGGFDNNADVLSMPPLLLEKYIESAEKMASLAILDPSELKSTEQERSGDGIGVVGDSVTESFYGRILKDNAFAWTEFDVTAEGQYRVRVQGGAWSKDEKPTSFVVYDEKGKPIYAGEWKQSSGGESHSATFNQELEVGKHFFIVAPVESLDDDLKGSSDAEKLSSLPTFQDLARLDEAEIKKGRDQFGTPLEVDYRKEDDDTVMMVRRIEIEGPSEFSKTAYPVSHFQIIRKTPPTRDRRLRDVDETAFECLKPLMEKMFRGPVDDETVKRYATLVKAATDRDESFQKGMRIALTAILVSPRFLFRVELPEEGVKPEPAGDYRVSNIQLASRLSYFLWSSAPDDTLLKLANEGKLQNEDELRRQVDRMLADPRSKSLATEFASQWLGLRNLAGVIRDTERFPNFNEDLVASMAQETQRFFIHVLKENHPAGDLIDANYTFVDKRLAEFYGLPWKSSDDEKDAGDFKQVSLESTARRGVLTHASVLTLTSYPTRTSPVQRGKWILENVLGTPPPEPPPNVPELEATKAAEGASVREQLALHRANPACASCHRVMDQLGFGFEQFDAIGQFRTDKKIDASGELPGGRVFEGGQQLAGILRKTESQKFAATVTEKLLGFSIGRELSPDDRCITDKIITDNAANDYRLADLVKSVVLSRPFQYFQPENSRPMSESTSTEPSK